MTLAIITHTEHIAFQRQWFAYSPYVREMNIWVENVSKVIVTAPVITEDPSKIHLAYLHDDLLLKRLPSVSLTSVSEVIKAVLFAPVILFRIFNVMRKADYIHLRCPGNIALMGCLVQVLFPKKKKSAKYAGNWDPNSQQPMSYRFQKWILSNTFLTRNMQVLVYGEWPGQSRNIKPFFTATYAKVKTEIDISKNFNPPFRFIFAGSLSAGKRPLYAIQLVERLKNRSVDCTLDIYGDGVEREVLESYIAENSLEKFITVHGNQNAETLEAAYRSSHFLILPSKSEGWPKVVAEAMFWGGIPVVTPISCVPWMLDNGNRGILLDIKLPDDSERLMAALTDENRLNEMSEAAQKWSHQYTLDDFRGEIKKIMDEGTATS